MKNMELETVSEALLPSILFSVIAHSGRPHALGLFAHDPEVLKGFLNRSLKQNLPFLQNEVDSDGLFKSK